MAQPIKKERGVTEKKKAKKKKKALTVSDIIKRNIERSKKPHPQYGTSKLEQRFAHDFLDKLGVQYEWQYEAKDIKRFYDFYLPDVKILLEIDGDFFHGRGLLHEEKSPMQKKNEYVDKIKDKWALEHGIPLIRIWEYDINHNPQEVMKLLKEKIGKYRENYIKEEEKKKRH